MTNNTRNAIYACLLLLAITVGACVKDSTVPESNYYETPNFNDISFVYPDNFFVFSICRIK